MEPAGFIGASPHPPFFFFLAFLGTFGVTHVLHKLFCNYWTTSLRVCRPRSVRVASCRNHPHKALKFRSVVQNNDEMGFLGAFFSGILVPGVPKRKYENDVEKELQFFLL